MAEKNKNIGLIITIDPIPEQNWGINLAHLLPVKEWDKLRKNVYKQYNYKCGICNSEGRMNCHEIWNFDDEKYIQKLVGFIALCNKCHDIKHWGRSVAMVHKGQYLSEYLDLLTKHFLKVNKCSQEDFDAHKVEVGNKQQERNKHKYKVDFGILSPDKLVVQRIGRLC